MTTVAARFAEQPAKLSPRDYNYEHFGAVHLWRDAQRTVGRAGIQPGALAPEFELPRSDGGTLRLRDLRGRPALLHFGSYT